MFQKGPTLEPGSYIVLAGAITVLNRYDALRGREAWLREILADGAVQRSADADDTGAYLLRHEAHSALEALTRAP